MALEPEMDELEQLMVKVIPYLDRYTMTNQVLEIIARCIDPLTKEEVIEFLQSQEVNIEGGLNLTELRAKVYWGALHKKIPIEKVLEYATWVEKKEVPEVERFPISDGLREELNSWGVGELYDCRVEGSYGHHGFYAIKWGLYFKEGDYKLEVKGNPYVEAKGYNPETPASLWLRLDSKKWGETYLRHNGKDYIWTGTEPRDAVTAERLIDRACECASIDKQDIDKEFVNVAGGYWA